MSTSRLDPGSRLTSHSAKARRVLVVGPGAGSQGGIAAVIENHRKSSFWREFHCEHFASIRDGSRLDKAFYTLWRWLRFVASIAWSRPAAVAIHTASASSFYRKFGYVLACKVFSVPVILHIHPAFFHDFYEAGGSFAQSLVRRAADWSRVIVFLSREQRDRFAGIFPADRLVVLPNPVDHHQYEAWEDGWQPKPQQVLYMGWIMREKGVYDLVDAIPAIRREFPGVRVLFAGTKEVEELRRYIA